MRFQLFLLFGRGTLILTFKYKKINRGLSSKNNESGVRRRIALPTITLLVVLVAVLTSQLDGIIPVGAVLNGSVIYGIPAQMEVGEAQATIEDDVSATDNWIGIVE
jgi:hypothetical protein